MKLKKDQKIKFMAINELTGRNIKLSGTVIGGYIMIRKDYPLEMGDVDKKSDLYLVDVPDHGGVKFFVVHISEVIKGSDEKNNSCL